MTACTLRMGRNTKELITVKENGARSGQMKTINDKVFYIIEVVHQKSTKSGKAAAVVLNKVEYKVLILYLDKLKMKVSPSENLVSPSSSSNVNY